MLVCDRRGGDVRRHELVRAAELNRGDAVPLLDGEDNPDQPNRTTVQFDDGGHDIADNHAIKHYVNGAAADSSANGSIQDQIEKMRQDGFLGGGAVVDVQTYQITRG